MCFTQTHLPNLLATGSAPNNEGYHFLKLLLEQILYGLGQKQLDKVNHLFHYALLLNNTHTIRGLLC